MPGTQVFSIQDAAAYPYTAGTPGALVDLVGVRSIEQSASTDEIENRGDDGVMATAVSFGSIELTITLAAFTPSSVAAISGGTVTTTGTGSTAITKLSRKTTDTVPYYKLAGQTRTKDADGGAARITYNKVGWRSGPDFAFTDNEFAEVSVGARAIPDATSELYLYEAYATWTALA